ncbi:MAG: ATP-dependent DNA helicase RecG, partial [Bacteroidales bacterium]|nr:ATP-dependent DNA helicase RecG [Bacteroidales bacterium]
MADILDTEIKFLGGVGPKRSELLNRELGISTFRDLLYYFPYKYIDRTKFYKISELDPEMPNVQVKGFIEGFQTEGGGRNKRLTAILRDDTGVLKLVWFKGLKWIIDTYKINKEYIIFGRPGLFNETINIVHPEIEDPEKLESRISSNIQAQYSTSEKLKNNYITSRTISKLQGNLFKQLKIRIKDTLPLWMREKYGLMDLHDALFTCHFPNDNKDLEKARFRMKLEELFYIQLSLLSLKINRGNKFRGHVFSVVGEKFNEFYSAKLPFRLTGAQKRVMKEIRRDLGTGKQMNRLLQGDVGSGKTLVALMSMLIAIDNGFQTCMMAPTEILTIQHFNTIT